MPDPEASGEVAATPQPSPQTDATPPVDAATPPDSTPAPEEPASDAPVTESTATVVETVETTPAGDAVETVETVETVESTATPAPTPSGPDDVIPLPLEPGSEAAPIVSESEVPTFDRSDSEMLDDTLTDPNSFIPDATSLSDTPPGPAGPSAGEQERRLKVRYQEVRTKVDKDPAVRSLREQARKAKTFEDERAAYREYYRLLFKKMRAADKELTERCNIMESAYLARLAQTRIEPTIPLNPPPTPVPLAE